MGERAVNMNSRLWLIVLVLASVFVLTPKQRIPAELVAFAVISPAVFLLPGWCESAARKGIAAITTRGDSSRKIALAEWVSPALAGTVLSSAAVFCVAAPPPWQFWIVSPLISASFSLLLLTTEQHFKYPGRTILCLMWLIQSSMSPHQGKLTDFLLFTDYPAAVLPADPASGSHHPDAYVLASLVVLLLAIGIYALLRRRIPR